MHKIYHKLAKWWGIDTYRNYYHVQIYTKSFDCVTDFFHKFWKISIFSRIFANYIFLGQNKVIGATDTDTAIIGCWPIWPIWLYWQILTPISARSLWYCKMIKLIKFVVDQYFTEKLDICVQYTIPMHVLKYS